MEFSLTIMGSATALARILQLAEENGASAALAPIAAPQMPGPPQGAPMLPVPSPAAASAGDDDENTPPNGNAPATDNSGLPWDERIHAKSKAMNGDGTWRKRRGVSEEQVAHIEAELRAANPAPSAPQPMPQMPTMPPPQMPTMPQGAPLAPQPMPQMPTMPPPQMPQMPQMPPPAPPAMVAAVQQATGALDMGTFMQHISLLMQRQDGSGAALVTPEYLAQVAGEVGMAFQRQVNSFTDIGENPQMITYAQQIFQRDGKWQ